MVREGIFFCTGINTVSTAGYDFRRFFGQIFFKVIDRRQSARTDYRYFHLETSFHNPELKQLHINSGFVFYHKIKLK